MSDATSVLDAIIVNEPAKAVDALQELIRAKAEQVVASSMLDHGGDEVEETE